MSTTEQELPAEVLEYLGSQNTLTLATASPTGTPHAATFLYVN
jgi:Pyridoxamine 5'-phosphate oxidase